MKEDNILIFPGNLYFCNFCGEKLFPPLNIFTCTVNDHLASMLLCKECLNNQKEKK